MVPVFIKAAISKDFSEPVHTCNLRCLHTTFRSEYIFGRILDIKPNKTHSAEHTI